MFGGADAKALIAIAIVFPYYPLLDIGGHLFPVLDSIRSPIFSLAVLGNAVLLPIAIVIAYAVRNLITVPLKEIVSNPIALFTGYLMKIDQIKGKHVRLMHRYYEIDGKIQKKILFGGKDADPETFKKLIAWQKEGKIGDKVWVTPKLPFLIPITMGFLIAVFYGDLLMLLMSFILHR
jgi:preflagellin peptidase FlaK